MNFFKNELKEIQKEEELFNDFCKYRKEIIKKCKNAFIIEDNEYLWGEIFNSKDSIEKKKIVKRIKRNKY